MAAQRLTHLEAVEARFCSCSDAAVSVESDSADTLSSPARVLRVHVADEVPLFRDSLARELVQHGLRVSGVTGLGAGPTVEADVTICGVTRQDDWDAIASIAERRRVLAVLAEATNEDKLRALKLGAAGVCRRTAPVEDIVDAVSAVQRGYALVDLGLLEDLCSHVAPPAEFELSREERTWLTSLASGTRITELAAEAGYSERAMYRLIRGLYQRMDVANLYQALMKATRLRLFD